MPLKTNDYSAGTCDHCKNFVCRFCFCFSSSQLALLSECLLLWPLCEFDQLSWAPILSSTPTYSNYNTFILPRKSLIEVCATSNFSAALSIELQKLQFTTNFLTNSYFGYFWLSYYIKYRILQHLLTPHFLICDLFLYD